MKIDWEKIIGRPREANMRRESYYVGGGRCEGKSEMLICLAVEGIIEHFDRHSKRCVLTGLDLNQAQRVQRILPQFDCMIFENRNNLVDGKYPCTLTVYKKAK